ncbi:NifB/NifX family molybdenum-iron cluster-binding protein [Methanocella arvoryzae]|uniref:Predicted iron-molybdenum cofactor biosynthesis protein n=1 Tax=Methanocella arvoryzae (strain DSM 22066 / NBRC 105507 / MRE50) TaxID=351160 RepID=Q0W904_METAR|nr:NifB/NifX family molybdenum-iron cluster-binding protein [Methanocella arvoryzae]CAJ35122.1 predicted iron-molybdenum cofactor biosynthesis protein [Methanocella arvoryzae MRE50]
MTRCALPVDDYAGLTSMVFEHFGRTGTFAIVDADEGRINSVSVITNEQTYGSTDKNLPDFLADHGVEIVLAGMMGTCMSTPLIDRGIRVFTGAEGTVREAYEKYMAGELAEVQKSRYSF